MIPGEIPNAIPTEILGSIPGDIPDAIPGEILGEAPTDGPGYHLPLPGLHGFQGLQ